MTTAILKSGIKVGNFSSAHPFTFDDGTVLGACTAERCKAMMLNSEEVELPGIKGTTDIKLEFSMSREVLNGLGIAEDSDIDIVIVPFPVLQEYKKRHDMEDSKLRVIRMVDRVNKIASSTRFCV